MKTEKEVELKIEENLKNVEEGKPLTISLAVLNGEFKKRYKEKFGEFEKLDKEEIKAHQKQYQKSEKYKQYQKSEKYKQYQKQYRKSDKYKQYQKQYRKSDKYKQYQKQYYLRKKLKGAEK